MADHTLLDEKMTMQFEDCIVAFEKTTRCEMRIHIEEENSTSVLDRAAFVFDHLGMRKTKERNAVLIYIQLYPSALAIIGDIGINQHVKPEDWKNWKQMLIDSFRAEEYLKGIQSVTQSMSELLCIPYSWNEMDQNELSNTISRAK